MALAAAEHIAASDERVEDVGFHAKQQLASVLLQIADALLLGAVAHADGDVRERKQADTGDEENDEEGGSSRSEQHQVRHRYLEVPLRILGGW
eukprot:CAMPEP_0180128638 /NCGR_PEP_ID=MMETSP0986-20121125/6881_1 /TAXON_ID=697907 /ORGANISM="non described non described, Strain CCMP2293" /LENGTH=92 /DNA_ID=CAMNT_0022068237 /DNA_START=452 /DNA_END=729 /DNA_ORIENTATION=-